MPTIAENLQTLLDQKSDIKEALANQGKAPTDSLGTYAGLIDSLENPDNIEYCVTIDGVNKTYAQLYGRQKVDLTATENDIRKDTVAITEKGVTTGEKNIPAYFARYGTKVVQANREAIITGDETDYKKMMVTVATFDTSISNSKVIKYVSIDDAMFEVGTGTKVADISKDVTNEQINLGIIAEGITVLRFFLVREEV